MPRSCRTELTTSSNKEMMRGAGESERAVVEAMLELALKLEIEKLRRLAMKREGEKARGEVQLCHTSNPE